MLDIDCLFMWRVTVTLPLWRAIVAFRVCGEVMKRLLEHGFYGLTLYMWRREPDQVSTLEML